MCTSEKLVGNVASSGRRENHAFSQIKDSANIHHRQSRHANNAVLPETAIRVESCLSHRKQMPVEASTRDWGSAENFAKRSPTLPANAKPRPALICPGSNRPAENPLASDNRTSPEVAWTGQVT